MGQPGICGIDLHHLMHRLGWIGVEVRHVPFVAVYFFPHRGRGRAGS